MFSESKKFFMVIALVLTSASFVGAQTIWDQSTVSMAYQGPGPVVMYNVPNGIGTAFDEAQGPNGPVDATITVIIRDGGGDPIPYFPNEDVWLEIESLCYCPSFTNADASGDAFGRLYWVDPLEAGGWSHGPTVVMISGYPIVNGELPISHNSPDLNCDLYVNLADIQIFAEDFYGGYTFRSDFHFDGELNLLDISLLAGAVGASCP